MTTQIKQLLALCAVVLGTITLLTNQIVVAADNDSQPPKLEMRTFKIDSVVFYAGIENATHFDFSNTNHTDREVNVAFQNFFKTVGVDLTAPYRSIAFNRRLNLLFVRATASELDTVERTIQKLTAGVSPQVHMKAYFIEVPKDGFVMPQNSGTTAAGEMTGILTSEQTKNLLQSLRAKPGAETLAQPEVVTTSGRQTQMRATDQTGAGPIVDLVPYVLSDGYTISLKAIVTAPASLSALVNIYDGQGLVLSKAEKSGDKQLIVLVTATVIDLVGNRVHSENKLPFNPSAIPPQPK